MSGYIHTIEFKVLIDSEVIDFTFRVPRGTLLIQVLDELETTLKIEPNIIAVINPKGEIDIIENHYSAIDYLVQKYGNEFFVGESSIVTFNHREYIVDLEIPEAIPFASTFRTACKSFSVQTQNVAIERQDGQVMDYEVFSMPTAFVLNSWGNFYRIVDRELGDPLIDPPTQEGIDAITSRERKSETTIADQMVYPPSMDEAEIMTSSIQDEKESLISEIDQLTDHFVESSTKEQETSKPDYPWERESKEPEHTPIIDKPGSDAAIPKEETIETILNDISVSDDEDDYEDIKEDSFLTRPLAEETTDEDEVITDVEELADKEVLTEISEERISDILEFTDEEERREALKPEATDEEFDYFAQDYDEEIEDDLDQDSTIGIEEEYEESISDLPEVEETMIPVEARYPKIEDEPPAPEEFQTEIYQEELETEGITESAEIIEEQQQQEIIDMSVDTEEMEPTDLAPFISSEVEDIETEVTEIVEEEPKLEALTDDVIIKSGQEISTPAKIEDDIPLEQRLEQRKQELKTLEAVLKEEEKQKVQKRSVVIEYYSKMNPRKIFPLEVRVPKINNNGNNKGELKITPVFPGCYITPHEEYINLHSEEDETVEFSITPLINNGSIYGKVGIWLKDRLLLNIKTKSKIRNYVGSTISGILAFILGILPFFLQLFNININSALASGINSTFSTSISGTLFMWIELGLLVVLLGLMVGFIFLGKPTKNKLKRQFYPIDSNEKE